MLAYLRLLVRSLRWIAWLVIASERPKERCAASRRVPVMSDVVGLPAKYFSDSDLLGQRVRLLTNQDLGHGYKLWMGETFTVENIALEMEVSSGFIRKERYLLVTNQRAKCVPVRGVCCELLFEWPQNVEGNSHGKSS